MRRQFDGSARILFVVATTQLSAWAQIPAQPPTRQDNVREVIHSVEIVDPYRWLEDQDGQETREWIAAQNTYAQSLLNPLPMRERIHKRLIEMYRHDSVSEPEEESGAYFFTKRGADQDLRSIYMRRGADAPDELLVDPQPLSADHTTSVTLDHALGTDPAQDPEIFGKGYEPDTWLSPQASEDGRYLLVIVENCSKESVL